MMGKPHLHLPQAHELYSIILSLEHELVKLDRFGAGIAAVHVNAAIEQLRLNLAVVNDNSVGAFDTELIWQEPALPDTLESALANTKDDY